MRYPTDSPLLRLQRVYSRSYYLQKSGVADPTIVGAFCELDTELRAGRMPTLHTIECLEHRLSACATMTTGRIGSVPFSRDGTI